MRSRASRSAPVRPVVSARTPAPARVSLPAPVQLVLAVALLLPLGVAGAALAHVAGIDLSPPSTLVYADSNARLTTHRPAASQPEPPPTLAPPTATAVPPTPTPVPVAQATPTAEPKAVTYTVQRGDELKHIAAQYGVGIWTIIDANDIPNPDSLRVGQVLTIPTN